MMGRADPGPPTVLPAVVNTGYSHHGANRTRTSMIGWNNVSASPDDDITLNIKDLRQRGRDLYMGNALANGAIKTGRTNVVGIGLQLNPQIDARYLVLSDEEAEVWELNTRREFALFADKKNCDAARMCDFYQLQQAEQVLGGVGKAAAYLGVQLKIPYEEAGKMAAQMQKSTGTADKDMMSFMDTVQRLTNLGVKVDDLNQAFSKFGPTMTMLGAKGIEGAKSYGTLLAMLTQVGMEGGSAGNALWNAAMGAGRWLLGVGKIVLMTAATYAVAAATAVWTGAQWLWNAAMTANPIGMLIVAVGALVAAGVWLYQNWDSVKQFWTLLWDDPMAAMRRMWLELCIARMNFLPSLKR